MKNLLWILACLFVLISNAQDPQFSQYYANPIYLNPAFTGLTKEHRAVANYRNQWMGISKAYSTYAISYDNNLGANHLGLGVQVIHDAAGTAALNNTGITGLISWKGKIDRFTEIRSGLSFGYSMMRFNFSNLVFNDQLYTGSASSVESFNFLTRNYVDIHSGVLVTSSKYWIGLSAKHMNRPDIDFSDKDNDRLPIKWSLHGGYKFMLNKNSRDDKMYISPTFNYRHMANFDQLDVGASFNYSALQAGLWYRGLPLKRLRSGMPNRDALVLILGYDLEKYNMRVGYSYDLAISALINNTSGSHELSIIYEISRPSRQSKSVLLTTPKF
ncbi:MAG: type IX secretion system membrane protein PorP/SprF [Bacteroidota bacterium]|jgi:type IX secretion system PorP/SprF family membrane protein